MLKIHIHLCPSARVYVHMCVYVCCVCVCVRTHVCLCCVSMCVLCVCVCLCVAKCGLEITHLTITLSPNVCDTYWLGRVPLAGKLLW